MYTREQVIADRKCGLKYVDRAVTKLGSLQPALDEEIKLAKECPGIWSGGCPR